jgi:carbamoyl-phosphate synthase large subunit
LIQFVPKTWKRSRAKLPESTPMPKFKNLLASTGEVGCFGDDLHEALLHALLATGFKVPRKGVLLSLGPLTDKYWFADEARVLSEKMGLKLYATHGTAEALRTVGVECIELAKRPENGVMTGMDAIEQGLVDLVINIPIEYDELGRPDGYHIRRRAVDAGIPSQAIIEALRHRKVKDLALLSWDEYAARRPVAPK